VPALQRMLDYTDQSIAELEAALDLQYPAPSKAPHKAPRKASLKKA